MMHEPSTLPITYCSIVAMVQVVSLRQLSTTLGVSQQLSQLVLADSPDICILK